MCGRLFEYAAPHTRALEMHESKQPLEPCEAKPTDRRETLSVHTQHWCVCVKN